VHRSLNGVWLMPSKSVFYLMCNPLLFSDGNWQTVTMTHGLASIESRLISNGVDMQLMIMRRWWAERRINRVYSTTSLLSSNWARTTKKLTSEINWEGGVGKRHNEGYHEHRVPTPRSHTSCWLCFVSEMWHGEREKLRSQKLDRQQIILSRQYRYCNL
jgi:hypothetical protein